MTDASLSYTPRQAAEITGISEYMINAAIRAGDLVAKKPVIAGKPYGRRVIRREDLDEWIKSGVDAT